MLAVLSKKRVIKSRPLIVTFIGHVDHGKTTLIRAITKANIAQEQRQITQKIGVYEFEVGEDKFILIDTPGHEIFASTRARSAHITDLLIIVVDITADMSPQTEEAISISKKLSVPTLVFVNKIDKLGHHSKLTMNIMNKFSSLGIVSTDLGGQTPFIFGSALRQQNLSHFVEEIRVVKHVLVSDRLLYEEEGDISGFVIDSYPDKHFGKTSIVIIKKGTVRVKDVIFLSDGREMIIRGMRDMANSELKVATPEKVVKLTNIDWFLYPGLIFSSNREYVSNISENAKNVNIWSEVKIKEELIKGLEYTKQEKNETIFVLVKCDNFNSIEPLLYSLISLQKKLKVFRKQLVVVNVNSPERMVGNVSRFDLLVARSYPNITIYGFNVNTQVGLSNEMKKMNQIVSISLNNIMSDIADKILAEVKKEQEKKDQLNLKKKEILGQSRVKRVFFFSKVGRIAGCSVMEGEIMRNSLICVKREGRVILENQLIRALMFEDKNIDKAKKGEEFGLTLRTKFDFEVGDIIIAQPISAKEKGS